MGDTLRGRRTPLCNEVSSTCCHAHREPRLPLFLPLLASWRRGGSISGCASEPLGSSSPSHSVSRSAQGTVRAARCVAGSGAPPSQSGEPNLALLFWRFGVLAANSLAVCNAECRFSSLQCEPSQKPATITAYVRYAGLFLSNGCAIPNRKFVVKKYAVTASTHNSAPTLPCSWSNRSLRSIWL